VIDWKPVSKLPEHLKDGRQVLLWSDGISPCADVGTWAANRIWDGDDEALGGYWEALYDSAKIYDITYFAEVQPPSQNMDDTKRGEYRG
jgi:hypothetical protein